MATWNSTTFSTTASILLLLSNINLLAPNPVTSSTIYLVSPNTSSTTFMADETNIGAYIYGFKDGTTYIQTTNLNYYAGPTGSKLLSICAMGLDKGYISGAYSFYWNAALLVKGLNIVSSDLYIGSTPYDLLKTFALSHVTVIETLDLTVSGWQHKITLAKLILKNDVLDLLIKSGYTYLQNPCDYIDDPTALYILSDYLTLYLIYLLINDNGLYLIYASKRKSYKNIYDSMLYNAVKTLKINGLRTQTSMQGYLAI